MRLSECNSAALPPSHLWVSRASMWLVIYSSTWAATSARTRIKQAMLSQGHEASVLDMISHRRLPSRELLVSANLYRCGYIL